MVLYVVKWDIHPDKVNAYLEWVKTSVPHTLAVPGVTEFRAYRAATGSHQVVVTYEFADMDTWATWWSHEEMQQVLSELHTLALNVTTELWGPSPVVPAPIRPGK